MIPGIILSSACAQPVPRHATIAQPAPSTSTEALPHIRTGENRQPAGRLRDGVLTIRLVARHGQWYPEGPEGLGLPVAAFAEEGMPLQNPGPLIRVPVGTEVRASVRNSLDKPLTILGLGERRGIAADSLRIERDSVREVRFRATEVGTYYYAGKTNPVPVFGRRLEDGQLNGAIVVDPPKTKASTNDRVFVISWWFTLDSTSANGFGRATLAINGQSWPHAEPLRVAQGDSLHWRWINLTGLDHPMHLHGFYFRVDGVGDGAQYTTYAPDQQRRAVTEVLPPGDSLVVRFTPPRAGTFMYHSHFNEFRQIASGLYGPIIVTEPGKRHDPETDRVHLFSDGGPTINLIRGPFPPALLNGSAKPEPMELRVGVKYRLRLINIRTDFNVAVALLDGAEPTQWRPVAKDGADLPAAQATSRPTRLTFAPGEIHDVEFTPRAAGELTLQFGEPRQRPTEQRMTSVRVHVR